MAVKTQQLDTLINSVRSLEPLIREHADEAEQNRRLSQPVVAAFAEAGLFRMFVPHRLGGLEVAPLTLYRIVEEVARIDGSTGWVLMIGATTAAVGAYVSDKAAAEIFGTNPLGITGGALFPPGKAIVSEGGYLASGRWPYASGCQHCTWLFGLCNAFEGDEMRLTPEGDPEVRAVFVPVSQATILDTWEVSGLAGTGSHDFTLEQIFVPEEYSWRFGAGMKPQGQHYQGPLYQFPFLGLFPLAIAPVGLGIAQGAVDASLELAQAKRPAASTVLLRDQSLFQVRMAEAVALVRSARAWLYAATQRMWEATISREPATFEARADLLLAAANVTRSAAAAVDIVYTAAGGTANYRRSPLQRALRDVHAVTQHLATAPQQFENAGRMLLGQQPLLPMILL